MNLLLDDEPGGGKGLILGLIGSGSVLIECL